MSLPHEEEGEEILQLHSHSWFIPCYFLCMCLCGSVCLCVALCVCVCIYVDRPRLRQVIYVIYIDPTLCAFVCVCVYLRVLMCRSLSHFSSNVCGVFSAWFYRNSPVLSVITRMRVFRCTYYVASVMHVHCVVCSYWQCTLNAEVCSAAITNAWGLKIMWLRHVSHNLVIFLHSIFSHFLGFTYKHIVWAIPWHINLS